MDGQPRRKSIAEARRLLAEAGWPNGRDARTGEPLVINLDTTATGVGAKARIDWLNKQFARIDTQLVVRSTDYNRFQEKVRKGAVQLFYFGWNADYPDPENFLFLLYGKQGKVCLLYTSTASISVSSATSHGNTAAEPNSPAYLAMRSRKRSF